MAAKLFIFAAAVLAVTPAAVTVALPDTDEAPGLRSISFNGPVQGLTQSQNRIQVRLTPAASEAERNARTKIIVRDAEGDEMSIPLKQGQTWASAELTSALKNASELDISVD